VLSKVSNMFWKSALSFGIGRLFVGCAVVGNQLYILFKVGLMLVKVFVTSIGKF
jgi:TM2 domain-containing membrane protein YozV